MIVVTGASGNVGRPLVRGLVSAGEQVTAVSRRPPDEQALDAVSHRQADLTEPESFEAALRGADSLFLLVAGEDPAKLLEVAKASGVRRVVLLSSQGAGTRPVGYRHPRTFERAVQESGLDWTILRPGGFSSNAFRWAETVRARGTVAAPFPDVALPTIDPADIAEVAAVVLGTPDHIGRTYELTGPAPISPRTQVRAIGEALGRPVRFVEQSRAEARAQMLCLMPEWVVDATLGVLGEPSAAEQRVSPAVGQLLGRPPGTFAEWAERNRAAFA